MTEQAFSVPQHIAIIMDGNGRWAKQRKKPRFAGHRDGVNVIEGIIKHCVKRDIKILSLFAFSSENWRRPQQEVNVLMSLFATSLQQQVQHLHENNIQLRVIGDISKFSKSLQKNIVDAQNLTADNSGMIFNIAANYGGRWDITQSVQRLAKKVKAGELDPDMITENTICEGLTTGKSMDPDLLIRTGGEQRISNFLLWQITYTELYFTDTLWPDFNNAELDKAITSFCQRERRFGRTSDQLQATIDA